MSCVSLIIYNVNSASLCFYSVYGGVSENHLIPLYFLHFLFNVPVTDMA